MLPRAFLSASVLGTALLLAACSVQTAPEEDVVTEENAVKVDTRSAAARAQYDTNVAFVNGYRAKCKPAIPGRKRVLVTGFGRFQSVTNNATGRMVASLLPGLAYPETFPALPGQVDAPEAQVAVGFGKLELPRSGEVEVCAMVLPVFWDVAAVLVAKEIEAFGPDFVLMNGVASARQDIWLELGSVNKAAALEDGSEQLRPLPSPGDNGSAPILERGPALRSNLLAWRAVEAGAKGAREAAADREQDGLRFGDIVQGVKLAGYPRGTNTYLCNNLTYVTGYLMDNPGLTVSLLRASVRVSGKPNDVRVRITRDMRNTPRAFAHWPADLAKIHTANGKDVMLAIIDAQLSQPVTEPATRGDNRDAAEGLKGGSTF